MIYLTPHPHAKKLDAIERASKKVRNWQHNYNKQAGDPNRQTDVSRAQWWKSVLLSRRIAAQHKELLYY